MRGFGAALAGRDVSTNVVPPNANNANNSGKRKPTSESKISPPFDPPLIFLGVDYYIT